MTAFAQIQINSLKGGGVQDLIQPSHLKELLIPVPPKILQEKIGKIVLDIYKLKDEANQRESEAIKKIETYMKKYSKV